ncbi:hypothetical protein ACIQUZ_35045 [Streptomyces griseus]|uniref:hypothetical protein n=1 Tax=Streptomyces griseus TaxID=1911 RepID=UPI00382E815F
MDEAKGAFIIADAARARPYALRAIDRRGRDHRRAGEVAGFDDDLSGEETRVANRPPLAR